MLDLVSLDIISVLFKSEENNKMILCKQEKPFTN